MNTIEAIQSRRAIKHYDPEYHMSEEQVQELLGLAMLSPTAFNIQHWRFVVVKDPAIRQQIRENAWDQAQVTAASLLLVLCADTKAWEKDTARYWTEAPAEVGAMMVPAIQQYYEGKERVQRDECMRSLGIAGQTIMLASKAMGLDSCPMDGFDYEAVGKIIHLPEDHLIGYMIAVGKGTKDAWPRPGQLPASEVILENGFGN